MSWEADIWSDGKRWHARYNDGCVMLCDGPAVPWVDHAKTQEKIEKKARARIASLTPEPPKIHYKLSDDSESVESGFPGITK